MHPGMTLTRAGIPSIPTPDTRPWIDRWLETCGDLAALKHSHPMMDAVIDEIDGRMIRVGDHWLADFASCNYLGFDLDREIIEAVPAYLDAWGTHPSWSRLLGSPVLYPQIEEKLTELLGAPDALVLPTITHIHMSVIPMLAAGGTIFLDGRAHKTIYDGCQVAKSRGATVERFRFEDPDHLDSLLRESRGMGTKLVCMDGVNSMTGNAPDLRAFAAVARAHGALLYVDDAHGFGVIGERDPRRELAYGMRGNGVVRHAGETYDNIVLVGGFSKAYSSLLAFITCPTWLKDQLKVGAPPYLYSGPSPDGLAGHRAGRVSTSTRSAATDIRADLYRKTGRCSTTCDAPGRVHAEPLAAPRSSSCRWPPARTDRRGRQAPVGPRRLRHAGRVPAGPRRPRSASAPSSPPPTPTTRSTS